MKYLHSQHNYCTTTLTVLYKKGYIHSATNMHHILKEELRLKCPLCEVSLRIRK